MRGLYGDAGHLQTGTIRRGCQARQGADEPDVVTPHLWIECKSGVKPNIWAAMRQAAEASSSSRQTPVVFAKEDGDLEGLVIMHYYDWEQMAQSWLNWECRGGDFE